MACLPVQSRRAIDWLRYNLSIPNLVPTPERGNKINPYPLFPIPSPMGMFDGKIGVIMGLANDRSIAWAISQALYAEGAELAFTHLPGPSSERRIGQLVEAQSPKLLLPCHVPRDEDVARVFAA